MSGLRRAWLLGAAAGLVVDRFVGEPPAEMHPVAAFGRSAAAVERRWWRDSRAGGAAFTLAGVGTAALAGRLLSGPSGRTARSEGGTKAGAVRVGVATALATTIAVAGRALGDEAAGVGAALDAGDLAEARRRLPALVGRDVDGLDEEGIARAVVESVAENTTDAVVAAAFWAALAGAPGALAYRAVNTLDAMVGHRSVRYQRFGWASARLDDAANWIPARLTAILVAMARPAAAPQVATALLRPPPHPSPNAALSEGAFAAALGVRLGGDVAYGGRIDGRETFGGPRSPAAADIGTAVGLCRDVSVVLAALLTLSALLCRRRGDA